MKPKGTLILIASLCLGLYPLPSTTSSIRRTPIRPAVSKPNPSSKRQALNRGDASQVFESMPRPGESATLMPDGRWLVLGGEGIKGPVSTGAFKDAKGAITGLSNGLRRARAWHTATLLPNGTVLVMGGIGKGARVLSRPELFDPATLQSESVDDSGLIPRANFTATLLTDGRLLIAGGVSEKGRTLKSVQLWDYRTGTVEEGALELQTPRSRQTATLLPDGNVLLWGGIREDGVILDNGEIYVTESRVFNISNGADEANLQRSNGATHLEASIPKNGATQIPLNNVISLRFSKPLRVESVNSDTILLQGPTGVVRTNIVPAEGGTLAFVTPIEQLSPSTTYTLSLNNADDGASPVVPAEIVFRTIERQLPLSVQIPEREEWVPDSNALQGNWVSGRQDSGWQTLPALQSLAGNTALSGQVLKLNGLPLAKVTLRVGEESIVTDETGRFLLRSISPGRHELIIDGQTASTQKKIYGMFEVAVDVKAGQTNVLPFTIWMPVIDTTHAIELPVPTTSDIVASTPLIPGLEVHIPANVVLRSTHGHPIAALTITPIPIDRPPFPLPAGARMSFTLQTHGARVESTTGESKGVTIIYPNYSGLQSGSQTEFRSYEAGEIGWHTYAQGIVTQDRKRITPGDGVGIPVINCIHYLGDDLDPTDGPIPGSDIEDGEPVELPTGLFLHRKLDLILPDVIPISLTRTYRQNDTRTRPFGVGATHPYDLYLVGDHTDYTNATLILPGGSRIRYERISPGSTQLQDAVMEHTATPTQFFRSTLAGISYSERRGWYLTLSNGTTFFFRATSFGAPLGTSLLTSIQDRNGNELRIVRQFDGSAANGRIKEIISPNGRWIAFTYDASNRITQARDNIGRTVNYTYDSGGRLWKVIDANAGVTEYTYDSLHRMIAIKDPRNIVYLTNEYDAAGRVFRQTQADNGTYEFAYTLNANGKVTQTDVTDPRGIVRRAIFNSTGYLLTDTSALSTPEQQTLTYERQAGSNLLLSVTDPLNRKTAYAYDPMGNVTGITLLAETSEAVSTTFTYEPAFNQVASVTDPSGQTVTYFYDTNGNASEIRAPLNRTTRITYNAAGQPTSITDPLNQATQLSYELGDLVTVTDSVNRTVKRVIDAAGRLIATTDPLGNTTTYEYNATNHVTRTTNSLGALTSFTYDPNGNLLTLTDAHNGVTSYSYNNMDQLESRTDQLLHVDSYLYDRAGNLTQFTDRREKVAIFSYDHLNRPTLAGFGAAETSYESTIAYTYDSVSRLTGIADSVSGNTTRGYDNLDRLTSEITPQGTVGYTYGPPGCCFGLRTGMSVSGQEAVAYSYDDAGRLGGITQGTSGITFGYDAADRLTSTTSATGVAVDYTYDSASQLTKIDYKVSGNVIGDLTYAYDAAGRVIKIGGSFARTLIPQSIASTNFNATNQLTQWGASDLSYDPNGNLTGDGTNTYTWDARNQLISIIGPGLTATFQYDAFGRRVNKTSNATSTNYLYDGGNVVQELSSVSPLANMLTVGTDQLFQRTDGSGTRTIISDALGSTLALLDAGGAIQTEYTFEPFGNTSTSGASSSNTSQYTGRENDGNGLYYYRARYYSPSLQRFISEDPIEFAGGDTNLYAYVFNSPTNLTDPSGLCVTPDTVLDVGFIIYDIYRLVTDGRQCRSANLTALGLDALGALIPVATGLGAASRAARAAEKTIVNTGGRFRDLNEARRLLKEADSVGHHMPSRAYNELSGLKRADGPALGMTTADHGATRTYAGRNVAALKEDRCQLPRDVLAKDIKDVRKNFRTKYNRGLLEMLEYVKTLPQFQK